MMWRLAAELDRLGHPDLADRVDRADETILDDVVEKVGRMYLSGMNVRDIAANMGKHPDWAARPLTRFWARYPELEAQHAPRGISIDWNTIREIGEAAELGFTLPEINELLDTNLSPSSMSRYYLLFRERFPHLSKIGRPTMAVGSTSMTTEQANEMSDRVAELRIGHGMSFSDIGMELGIAGDHAKVLFYRHHLPRHPEHSPTPAKVSKEINAEKIQRMFEMYADGVPLATIAREHGYASESGVWAAFTSSLPIESMPKLMSIRRKDDPEEVARIHRDAITSANMRIQLKEWSEIAETIGVHPATAMRYCRIATMLDPSLVQPLKDASVIMGRKVSRKPASRQTT